MLSYSNILYDYSKTKEASKNSIVSFYFITSQDPVYKSTCIKGCSHDESFKLV